MTARRELTSAVLGAVASGALALVAGGQAWAEVTADRRAPLPPVSADLSGADAAPLVPAAGLVLLAAAVALLAVRGAGRVAVGLLAAAAGGALLWSGGRALAGGLDDAGADLPGLSGATVGDVTADVAASGPLLVVLAGLVAVATGALVVLRGRSWPGMGRRYERTDGAPAAGSTAPARPRTDEDRAVDAWKALDRGEDPTDRRDV
ncbi:Trp biosynthesis-associated membrane protein [Blastococcus sp. TML/M2B]|uniref:Trp biosynthesis-associated membrane protein n=1 Tax=unclassified Blastococcus TaxID=2619396 RepID=UPI00190AC291|nr:MULTISPECIES: Trp biosynthesis-associated membrane protein [unclassified Blastococcus]MBN1092463.1 Trp biosynthesis-associated membrane protein [Blastococcus sp. TML/M2B]MBN1097441.1 Trp biosynthesis-associated membrane protein [Blastococcus sp. TML/C7B]